MKQSKSLKAGLTGLAIAAGVFVAASTAQAGNIVLTGHDILLHRGGDGYDAVILDYLRGVGSMNLVAKANYDIAVVGTAGVGATTGFGDSGGPNNIPGLGNGGAIPLVGTTLSGYQSATFYDAQTADWGTVLMADVLVILSHVNCGGCSLTTAGSAAVNAQSAGIATAFNAGMDIWGLSGANLATYYDFLPAGVVATGAAISGSNFTPTAAGAAIGITEVMTDGDATHNRFSSADPVFTVLECRTSTCDEIVTIGVQDATIDGGGIITDPGPMGVPEPGTLALFGLGLVGLGFARRRKAA